MKPHLPIKKITLFLYLAIFSIYQTIPANEPDSAYLFSYATNKNAGHNGLHFAWSTDRKNWHAIGPEYSYVRCDYGRWGAEKRMLAPFLFRDINDVWRCIWSLNEKDGAFAHVTSDDLIYWKRQSYPIVMPDNNCTIPEVWYDKAARVYTISWLSTKNGETEVYGVTTKDFQTYSPARLLTADNRLNLREQVQVGENAETGRVHKVVWSVIDALIKKQQLDAYNKQLNNETTKDDSIRFASLPPIDATITVNAAHGKKISDLLVGIFFEDINYAADGGLYAELIQNRGFEYALSDKEGRDKTWNSYKSWELNNSQGTFAIDTASPIHPNNNHYAILKISHVGTGLINEGFDGIAITSGEKYDFSFFARNLDNKHKKLAIRLIGPKNEIYGESTVNINSSEWKKITAVLTANQTVPDARLEIAPQTTGAIALDMISLFPQQTFKGRKNGLRADLAQTLANIHPRFVRFPGGCVAHGDGIGNIYRWKNTIGPLETRKPQRNLWGYHQTAGLGYFEYFQFCEDIGAEPLPVIAAGVPCQNSATGGAGQQGGIPMCDMNNYIRDILDLIEWANGDAKTTWGRKRAEAGHPKPFNLKFIGIGNEDLISDIFEERFTMIYKAITEKHPEITVIGTVGPASEGADYTEGWNIAAKLGVPIVDEHYYQSPGWFINNQEYYDRYDRSKSKVYLGEYAAHLPGRPNNIETALAEALYLTALERNGDVISMASYAPLLAKEKHTQWNPNLIYFNNTEIKPTVGYYVQQLYGHNAGDTYIENSVRLSDHNDAVRKRVAVSVVRDSKTGDIIIKLVNILPVTINTQIKLEEAGTVNPVAIRTVLTGIPADKKARPVTNDISVSDNFLCTLPAYSFTVIRLKTK